MPQAYPLEWPQGWRRTPPGERKPSSRFKVDQRQAIAELYNEVDQVGESPILSTNLEPRLDGMPKSKQRATSDPGAALYFQRGERPIVMACDTYDDLKANIRAIGLTLEAMRTIERHGASDLLERAFTGFVALPPAGAAWHELLGVSPHASAAEIDSAFRAKCRAAHPDSGGSAEAFTALTRAREEGKRTNG